MKILFVADGRSPITSGWIRYFIERGHEVHLASTYPFHPDPRLSSTSVIPTAFSSASLVGGEGDKKGSFTSLSRRLTTPQLRTSIRQWLGPLTLPLAARRLRKTIDTIVPDFVHAMRIPYEGMLATFADPPMPLIISVWGNDFTLHALSNAWMAAMTRRTMARADALHTDCHRDLRLASSWGFSQDAPAVVLPSGGGIDTEVFHAKFRGKGGSMHDLDEGHKITVINPRGFRAYVRNDTFFKSIPIVLSRGVNIRFVCPAMAGETKAERWLRELGIGSAVELLPKQSHPAMAHLYRKAQVSLSITDHDGTPNTLLESMACGCFPIAGDLESIREWITHLENGLIVDQGDPNTLAEAILFAITHPELRAHAKELNARIIAERAEYKRVMAQAEQFYLDAVIRKRGIAGGFSNYADEEGPGSQSGGRVRE